MLNWIGAQTTITRPARYAGGATIDGAVGTGRYISRSL